MNNLDVQKVQQNQEESTGEVRLSKLVKSVVQIHEVNQAEIVFSYSLRAKDNEKTWVKPFGYLTDIYLIFPPQMRITKESYPIETFYHDIRSFIRFREPKLTYKEMLGMGRKTERSPLMLIENYIRGMKAGEIADPPEPMIEEARVFGCSYFSYFQRRMDRFEQDFLSILSKIQKEKTIPWDDLKNTLTEAEENLEKSYQVLKTWRIIAGMTEDFPKDFLAALKEEIDRVNEYCSYIFRAGLLRLSHFLESMEGRVECEEYRNLRQKIFVFVRLERWYSKQSNFFWVDEHSTQEEREGFLYRRGLLKRRIWSSLYLNSRIKPLFSVQKQVGAMIAAGLAGAWGVVFTIFMGRQIMASAANLLQFGTLMMIFIFSAGYILKDRIKELGRGYFKRGILGRLPDTSNRIYYKPPHETETMHIGTVQERATHLPVSKLGSDMRNLIKQCNSELGDDSISQKTIIHYQKFFSLEGTSPLSLTRKIRAVHDVVRVYVDNFLAPLDARNQEVLVFTQKGRVKTIPAAKVYFLDLVITKAVILNKKNEKKSVTEYHRVILSKKGIERIETLI